MSLTTISGSVGLRVGGGDGRLSSSKKATTGSGLSETQISNSKPLAVSNNNLSKMTGENSVPTALAVPVHSNTPVGGPSSTASSAQGVTDSPGMPVSSSSSSTRAYGQIVLTLENVLLPPEKLNPTPSAQDGLDPELEMDLRVAGCELISSSGILLKLPQVRTLLI